MPMTSSKNQPLTSAGADLGLQGGTPTEDEDEKVKRKERLSKTTGLGDPTGFNQAYMDLGL